MSKPKEILINAINTYLREKLETEGYSFYEKSVEFKKKGLNDFTCIINFLGSRTNWLDQLVNFKVQYLIYAPKYKTWHKKNFSDQTMIGGGYLPGNGDILRQQSTKYQYGFGYDFIKFPPENIMEDIWKNYLTYGVDYFASGSDWSKVYENSTSMPIKIDSLIFQDKIEEALTYIQTELCKYLELQIPEVTLPAGYKQNITMLKLRLGYLENINRL